MIRIRKKLESDTLFVPELLPWLGHEVEITLHHPGSINVPTNQDPFPLRDSIIADDDPFGPAVSPEEWEPLA